MPQYETATAPTALRIHQPKSCASEAPPPVWPRPETTTVPTACQISGLGPTTIWALIRDGRLEVVRVAGIKRTLIVYDSLMKLLTPTAPVAPPKRRRGRPRGHPQQG